MTPRVRKLAIATALLVAALVVVARIRGARAREQAEPLTEALVALLNSSMDAMDRFLDVVAAHPHDCGQIEQLGRIPLAANRPRHAQLYDDVQRLRDADGPDVADTAARLAFRRVQVRFEAVRKREAAMAPALRQFRDECPKEAADLDALVVGYATDTGHDL